MTFNFLHPTSFYKSASKVGNGGFKKMSNSYKFKTSLVSTMMKRNKHKKQFQYLNVKPFMLIYYAFFIVKF